MNSAATQITFFAPIIFMNSAQRVNFRSPVIVDVPWISMNATTSQDFKPALLGPTT